ncbi:hypothetical protein SAMN05444679_104289 [Variovorax sp. CF079]|uniref:hypothetical protein n=1 Tax=Variovorax sp. CF079 TaxID=1882774 RepID=UPI00088FAD4A|nr:hypothetical protein [Variovorax sp. CF079]SDC67882.1 hypothetical protein SAMN05444679_104289 [Variovorax sp. CF079]
MNITLCTLFERNYHFGVAALANSLIAAGYTGELWVGYRGALPGWIVDSPAFDRVTGRLQAAPGLVLCMLELDTPLHFTYYKPTFIREMLEKHAPQSDVVAYIDPDIVVKCDWPALTGWFTEDGISLAEDVNWCFPARHPKRLLWARFFEPHGATPRRGLDRYYNAGFIAVSRAHLEFLDLWRRLCDLVVAYNEHAKELKAGGSAALFHSTDQDALNFALTVCEAPLNTAGPEAMDFAPGGYYLSHAVGSVKPWHGGHIRQALRGMPPSAASKWYYHFANAPIKAYSDGELAKRQLSLKIAAAIGRVYKRA